MIEATAIPQPEPSMTPKKFGSSRDVGTMLVVAAASLVALALVTGVIEVPSIGGVLVDLSDTLGAWTYLLVPVLALLETAAFLGFVIPGETAVLVGGVVAERGEVSIVVLTLLVWIAAVAGDLVSFSLGRRLGPLFLRRHGNRLRIRTEHIERVERLFEQHSGKTIVVGRFVSVLRPLTPFVAGTSGVSLRRFLPYSAGAALAWATAFSLLGFLFSGSIVSAGETVTRVTLAGAVVLGIGIWIKRSRRPPAPPAAGERRQPPTTPARGGRTGSRQPAWPSAHPSDRSGGGWLREATYFALAYLVYVGARWIFTGDAGAAQANAAWIWNLEQATGTAIEGSVQQAFSSDIASSILSNLYLAAQMAILPASFVWLYRRSRPIYRKLRTTIIATWMLSVPIFALFPVAPPRLAGLGLVDTVSDEAAVALTGSSTIFYNAFAAVPSLHVGFAFAISIATVAAVRARWAKLLAASWGPIVTLTVVATANHYVFDVLAGIAVTAAGFAVWHLLARRSERPRPEGLDERVPPSSSFDRARVVPCPV